jgi:hypothetical protein
LYLLNGSGWVGVWAATRPEDQTTPVPSHTQVTPNIVSINVPARGLVRTDSGAGCAAARSAPGAGSAHAHVVFEHLVRPADWLGEACGVGAGRARACVCAGSLKLRPRLWPNAALS